VLVAIVSKVVELYGIATTASRVDWARTARRQQCPFLRRKCTKTRKSQPSLSIGTCTVAVGSDDQAVIICPQRLLERRQVFTDCLHLLQLHEPGNELHVVPEISVPGGSVDYFLVSARGGRVRDFAGIELQTLDTTGTVWPARQRFLFDHGVRSQRGGNVNKSYGMNWKMTAKTTLVQLHHKTSTFEQLGKHLVLAVQECLMDYMRREFRFDHVGQARLGDPFHFHAYALRQGNSGTYSIELSSRYGTDSGGIATCLGLQADANVELSEIVAALEAKISNETLLQLP
jgi:hypothetical protein